MQKNQCLPLGMLCILLTTSLSIFAQNIALSKRPLPIEPPSKVLLSFRPGYHAMISDKRPLVYSGIQFSYERSGMHDKISIGIEGGVHTAVQTEGTLYMPAAQTTFSILMPFMVYPKGAFNQFCFGIRPDYRFATKGKATKPLSLSIPVCYYFNFGPHAVFGIFTAFGTAFKGNYFLDASIKLGYTFL
jgi:hypothetical protein